MRALPMWSRVLGAVLVVLLVNLMWGHPLREMTGGGPAAFLLLNLLPSVAAVAWVTLGGSAADLMPAWT